MHQWAEKRRDVSKREEPASLAMLSIEGSNQIYLFIEDKQWHNIMLITHSVQFQYAICSGTHRSASALHLPATIQAGPHCNYTVYMY